MENPLDRVTVIGTSCSGKTTLARTMAAVLNVPHIELDALHWQPNWTPRPLDEFRTLTQAAVAADRWVLDGNYSKVREIVWGRATGLIWLNYPFPVVAGRALVRTVKRVLSREQLYAGNRESFRQSFLSTDSILWWVLKTYRRRRRECPDLFNQPDYAHLAIMELNWPHQAEALVAQLKAGTEISV